MRHGIKALMVGAFFVLGLAQQGHSGLITDVVLEPTNLRELDGGPVAGQPSTVSPA
jgi:hypothetical protein